MMIDLIGFLIYVLFCVLVDFIDRNSVWFFLLSTKMDIDK